jgi:NTP pyrophosphatase (non-canonical NTP hydrolase)
VFGVSGGAAGQHTEVQNLEEDGYGGRGGEEEIMQLNEYQELAQRTARRDIPQEDHLFNGVLGLAGEAGECADLVKKQFFQDGRAIRNDLIDELGDVMWYVAETAAALGVTLEEVAQHNVDKLKRRYPAGFDADRSLHREV